MKNKYIERPRKGGGNECLIDNSSNWRRLQPIAFTAENAQKVHAEAKTQTRRLLNPQPCADVKRMKVDAYDGCALGINLHEDTVEIWKPRHRVGDVLWVQEPWRTLQCDDDVRPTLLDSISAHVQIHYEGTGKSHDFGKLRPGRFLPLRFSRPYRYEVTAVRLERVNEISEADALAEGCPHYRHGTAKFSPHSPVKWFAKLWNSIHDAPGTRFEDAPWVFAYTFRRAL